MSQLDRRDTEGREGEEEGVQRQRARGERARERGRGEGEGWMENWGEIDGG